MIKRTTAYSFSMSHQWISKQDLGNNYVCAEKARGLAMSKLITACPGTKLSIA